MFDGVRCQLMHCHANALRGLPAQAKLGPFDGNTGSNRVRKVSELRMHEGLEIDPLPFVLDKQVEIDGERLYSLSELFQKIARTRRRGLAGNCQNDSKHVLRPMVDLEHEQAHLLLRPLAIRNVDAGWHDSGDAAVGCKDGCRLKINPPHFALRRILEVAAYCLAGQAARHNVAHELVSLRRIRPPGRVSHEPADDLLARDSGSLQRAGIHLNDLAAGVEQADERVDSIDNLPQALVALPQSPFALLALSD